MLRLISQRVVQYVLPKRIMKIDISNYSSHLHTASINRNSKGSENRCEPTPVAVILCGCGGLDGTEISECVSLAINLSQNNFQPKFFAPDVEICGVVDHFTKEHDPCGLPRNALVEAARLARSSIKSICHCKANCAEALIIPGGFGAVRTLTDFAAKGKDCAILPELKRIIEEFNCEKKPIGSLCIASALIARVLEGVKVTLGKEGPNEDWPYADAIARVKDMGAKVEEQDVKGVSHCKQYNVYSTPAWMYANATYAEVHQGIGNMIAEMTKGIVR